MGEKALPKTPSLTKKTSSTSSTTGSKQQKSILGFFSKASQNGPSSASGKSANKDADSSPCLKETTKSNSNSLQLKKKAVNITPVPSSDAIEPSSSQENHSVSTVKVLKDALPSPVTPAELPSKQAVAAKITMGSSPSRKVSTDPWSPKLR